MRKCVIVSNACQWDATVPVLRLSSVASPNACLCLCVYVYFGFLHKRCGLQRGADSSGAAFPGSQGESAHQRASVRGASTSTYRFRFHFAVFGSITSDFVPINFSRAHRSAECLGLPRSRRCLSKLETCRCRAPVSAALSRRPTEDSAPSAGHRVYSYNKSAILTFLL